MSSFETMKTHHYSTLLLVCLICAVGVFDFLVFWRLSDIINLVFVNPHYDRQSTTMLLLILFVIGYVGRPMGGILIGRYGDKKGRKSALFASLLGVGVFSLILGVLPTFKMVGDAAIMLFFLARLAQGLFFGGIYPACLVCVVESLPVRHIGIGSGILVAFGLFALLGLMVLVNMLESTFTLEQMHQFGFRLPLIISGFISLMLLFGVQKIPETPVFIKKSTQTLAQSDSSQISLKNWQIQLTIFVLCLGFASIFVVNNLLFIDLASLVFFVPQSTLGFGTSLSIFFAMLGAVFFGYLTDITNAAKVLTSGLILFIASFTLLTLNLKDGGDLALLYFVLMGFFAGTMGAIAPAVARLAPTKVRLTNFATLYNIAFALVGIAVPPILGYLTFYSGFAPLIYMALMATFMVFCSFYVYYEPRSADAIES